MITRVRLKPGREKSVTEGHPWLFSGSFDNNEIAVKPGETVQIDDAQGNFLAYAAWSPLSNIRARIWTRDPAQKVDSALLAERVEQSAALRRGLLADFDAPQRAFRLVHGESDGLPGIVIDRYGSTAVMQLLSAGAQYWKPALVEILSAYPGIRSVYERSDADVSRLEGFEPTVGLLQGDEPADPVILEEHGLEWQVDIREGQKTGFYLDQRENRRKVGLLAAGKRVLNCFCYTGGFSLNALAGGAEAVLSIDSSAEALRQASENLLRNGLDGNKAEWWESDVFQALRKLRDQARFFDLIILDPPKFAPTAAQAERAARAYKDINLLAFKLLVPGGLLVTFSCSGGVDAALFRKIVAGAALDAKADALVVESLEQDRDHPVSLAFPQGSYLKGLICLKRA